MHQSVGGLSGEGSPGAGGNGVRSDAEQERAASRRTSSETVNTLISLRPPCPPLEKEPFFLVVCFFWFFDALSFYNPEGSGPRGQCFSAPGPDARDPLHFAAVITERICDLELRFSLRSGSRSASGFETLSFSHYKSERGVNLLFDTKFEPSTFMCKTLHPLHLCVKLYTLYISV